jgi:hypothetical protein
MLNHCSMMLSHDACLGGYMAAWAGPGDDTDEEIRPPHRVPRRRRLGLRPRVGICVQ